MKNTTIFIGLLFLVLFQIPTYAQVGIGTTTPDASSILDIESTTQGILTPRMTTAQRIAIASPAEGLMVFDTDEGSFFYFDSTVWVELEGSVTRDNYKLVKSAADLADELAAGGGATYVLDENFMYEINGIITFSFPIDLNGAYLRGHDTGEDILVNSTGGALFRGSKGGRMKDLLINGGGSSIFDITGTGSENVIGYSIVITSASSIGTLSNLGVVFFSVLQMVNSSDGLDVSNINSFFVQNIFWTGNTGTCLTFSGTFGNLQIANGRIVVESGDTGIDVSADPTITLSASLTGVNISGAGDHVNGYVGGTYPGYNFTNDWDVNCPGIPVETDGVATGDINFSAAVGSGTSVTFSGTGTSSRRKIPGTTVSNSLFRFAKDANNRIVYEGKKTRYFGITASLSYQGDSSNNIFIFYLAKNGTVIDQTKVYRENAAVNDVGSVAVVGTVELVQGDFVEVWAERWSGTGGLFLVSLNLIAR
ncbi:hypothetical protein [Algibacter lectus]|uniref:Cell wall anchor protein n=1 Tax=Algibacter lectus TaxID=221126 RepID=A0A090VEZ5_9FLAO|nr:hypothetical protein [Algibacter lectus]GAL61934.1 hypothetical protein JCM19300_680 [Algibacter lectus]